MSEETAKQMMWHKKGMRIDKGKMGHPSDGKA
jgi:hypothetical protein